MPKSTKKHAIISLNVICDPNIFDIAESHQYKLSKAIVERDFAPKNHLSKVQPLQNGQHMEQDDVS